MPTAWDELATSYVKWFEEKQLHCPNCLKQYPTTNETKIEWIKGFIPKLSARLGGGRASPTSLPAAVMQLRHMLGAIEPYQLDDFYRAQKRSAPYLQQFGQNGISLFGYIDELTTAVCRFQLTLKSKEASVNPITLVIDSPGGSVEVALETIDDMWGCRRAVNTWTLRAFSAASLIALYGRHLTVKEFGDQTNERNRPLMIHQMTTELKGNEEELRQNLLAIEQLNHRVNMYYRGSKMGNYNPLFDTRTVVGDDYIAANRALTMGIINYIAP